VGFNKRAIATWESTTYDYNMASSSGKGLGPKVGRSELRDFEVESVRNKPDVRQQVLSRGLNSSLSEWSPGGEDFEGQKLWQKPTESFNAPAATQIHATPAPTREVVEEAPLATDGLAETPWAVSLALDERRMESEGVIEVSNSFRKQELLKLRTREFMLELHRGFCAQVEVFNEARRQVHAQLRVFRVSGTENDFMLFRNGVRLLVSGARAGRVSFAFNQYLGQVFSPSTPPQFELEALWGAFDQLHWTFKGERVSSHDVIRYLLTEFTRQSCR
jgi:hypothetical protein